MSTCPIYNLRPETEKRVGERSRVSVYASNLISIFLGCQQSQWKFRVFRRFRLCNWVAVSFFIFHISYFIFRYLDKKELKTETDDLPRRAHVPSESTCRIPSTGIIRLGCWLCWLCWLLDWMKLSPETCTAHYVRLARPNPHIIQPQIRRSMKSSQSGRIAFQLIIANFLCFFFFSSSHFFCTLFSAPAWSPVYI